MAVLLPLTEQTRAHRLLWGLKLVDGKIQWDRVTVGGHSGQHVWRDGVEVYRLLVEETTEAALRQRIAGTGWHAQPHREEWEHGAPTRRRR